jgi:hypothetical protein
MRERKSVLEKAGHSSEYPARTHFDWKCEKSNWNTLRERNVWLT